MVDFQVFRFAPPNACREADFGNHDGMSVSSLYERTEKQAYLLGSEERKLALFDLELAKLS